MFVRTQTNGSRTYLLIVDNVRVGGKVKQRVLLRLGRLDELLASGRLDALIRSLGRFSEKLAVLGAHAQGDSIVTHSAKIGPALIFQRLWQSCSIDQVLSALLKGRRFEFSVERAIFLRAALSSSVRNATGACSCRFEGIASIRWQCSASAGSLTDAYWKKACSAGSLDFHGTTLT